MEALPVFFALNHPNYARRIPILSRYLDLIPDSTRVMFDNNLKQAAFLMAREQANKRVTGIGGMNGLTENPFMLERWILTGPEIQYNISPSDLISLLYGGCLSQGYFYRRELFFTQAHESWLYWSCPIDSNSQIEQQSQTYAPCCVA